MTDLERYAQQLRQRLNTLAERRQGHVDQIVTVRSACMSEERDPTEDEARTATDAATARDQIDANIVTVRAELDQAEADLRARTVALEMTRGSETAGQTQTHSPAHIVREERTYTPQKSARGEASFFIDGFAAAQGNQQARARIERNLQEAITEGEITARATSTSSFAGLVVPQYLVNMAALLVRAGRPFANTVMNMPLPEQGMSLIIPRGTVGAATAVQATENASVQNTDQVWANLTVPVVTIAGQQDVSRQSLERGTPGIDELVYMDLAGAYAQNIDTQVIAGSGSAGQMLGVLNTAGVAQSTAFTAAATPASFYSKLAGALNSVETTRYLAPSAIAMSPRRWNWLIAQLDSQSRPLLVPNAAGPMNALGTITEGGPVDTNAATPVGTILGLPVITDPSIPLAIGSGPEDQVIVYRREDLILWQDGDGMPKQLRFEQTLGNQLTVKLVVYAYAAFTAGRYPASVGLVGGNSAAGFGLVAPTF